MIKLSKKQNIKKYLASGALVISIAPLICNGDNCTPISAPDSSTRGSFYYDFLDTHFLSNVSVSGVFTSTTSAIG